MDNYFIVKCKCGHVGKKHFLAINFPIKATSGKEAALKGRNTPRVKHDQKYAVLSCTKVSYGDFLSQVEENNQDPYLKCKSRHEQKKIEGLEDRLEIDHHNDVIRYGIRNNHFIMKRNRELVATYESEIQDYYIEEYIEEDF